MHAPKAFPSEFPFGQRPKTRSRRRQRRLRGGKTQVTQQDLTEMVVSEILRGYFAAHHFGLRLTYGQVDLFYDIRRLHLTYPGILHLEKNGHHISLGRNTLETISFYIDMLPFNAFARFQQTGETYFGS